MNGSVVFGGVQMSRLVMASLLRKYQVGDTIEGIHDAFENKFPQQKAKVVGIATAQDWIDSVVSQNPNAKEAVERQAKVWGDKTYYYEIQTD